MDARDAVSRRPRQKRARADGTQSSINAHPFSGRVRSPVACSHWVNRVSWRRLLEKDHPGFGPRVAHWAENDAYPYLTRSHNEALRAHIWGQARAKHFVTIFGAKSTPPGAWNSAHARMPASARRARTMLRAECCCCHCCW